MNMAFKVLFLAHAPEAEPEKHRCLIEMSKFKLFVRMVKDQAQAVEVCKNLVKEEGIHSILLCPGFTHSNIAEISEAVGENVGVSVARGDGPSNRIAMEVMKKEGWFGEEKT
jgi:biotin synthase-related radical SAM superfamily protein